MIHTDPDHSSAVQSSVFHSSIDKPRSTKNIKNNSKAISLQHTYGVSEHKMKITNISKKCMVSDKLMNNYWKTFPVLLFSDQNAI
jgi:hypothetical protein